MTTGTGAISKLILVKQDLLLFHVWQSLGNTKLGIPTRACRGIDKVGEAGDGVARLMATERNAIEIFNLFVFLGWVVGVI